MRIELKHYLWETIQFKALVSKFAYFKNKTHWSRNMVLLQYVYINDSIAIDHIRVSMCKKLRWVQKWDIITGNATVCKYFKRLYGIKCKQDFAIKNISWVKLIGSNDSIRNLVINIFWYA